MSFKIFSFENQTFFVITFFFTIFKFRDSGLWSKHFMWLLKNELVSYINRKTDGTTCNLKRNLFILNLKRLLYVNTNVPEHELAYLNIFTYKIPIFSYKIRHFGRRITGNFWYIKDQIRIQVVDFLRSNFLVEIFWSNFSRFLRGFKISTGTGPRSEYFRSVNLREDEHVMYCTYNCEILLRLDELVTDVLELNGSYQLDF